MAAPRTKWLLLILGIVFLTWTALAVQQQVKKVDDKSLKDAGKGTEWSSNGMNWAEQRYSTMAQITPENVSKLALAWSYELGPGGGSQQATPLYSNGVLYTVTNWSIVSAIDAKTGKEIWRYDPEADRTMNQPGKSRLCCGVNSRGIALYEGKVLVPVVDGRMQALDAATGNVLWSSWEEPALFSDVEAAGGAAVAQDPAALEFPDVKHRQRREQCLPNRQPLQLKAGTMLHRNQPQPELERTTTRNCLCTLLRTESTLDRSHAPTRRLIISRIHFQKD